MPPGDVLQRQLAAPNAMYSEEDRGFAKGMRLFQHGLLVKASGEPGHELNWLGLVDALRTLTYESHQWVVASGGG